jgi:hypothetical protein
VHTKVGGATIATTKPPPAGTSTEIQDLVLEFLHSNSQASSVAKELFGTADKVEIRASLLLAVTSVLRGCKDSLDTNLVKLLSSIASAMGSTGGNSVFDNTKGAPQSSLDRLRSALFGLLSELAALLSESSAPSDTRQSIVEAVRMQVIRIWHCELGANNEDYVIKTGIIPALQRIILSLSTGEFNACLAAWHLLVSLIVYCFRETGGDDGSASHDPSCRGFIVSSLASQLQTILAQLASPDQPTQKVLPSGQACTLIVSALLVLCQSFKSCAPLVAD